jgi:diguanylate cyclase (GGDEF)-like protein/PAS domain S-box-containing protein
MVESSTRHPADTQLRLLSRAVEQSPTSVVITNLAGEIEYVNPKFTQLTGYTFEEAIGQNPRILKSGENPPELYRELWDTIVAGKEWRGELNNRKKNGDTYWEFASISGVIDASGSVTHYVAVKEDITQRKEIENHLRESEERFRNIFENSPVAYLSLDQNGCLQNANANLLQLLGSERETLIGRPFAAFWAPDTQTSFAAYFSALQTQRYSQTDLSLLRENGDRIIVSLESRLQTDRQGNFIRAHCTLFNITERQQMQARLQRQNDSLSALHQSALEFYQHRDLTALFQSLVAQATRLLDSSYGEMLSVEGNELLLRAATNTRPYPVGQRMMPSEALLTWQAVQTREPAVINDYDRWEHRNPSIARGSIHAVVTLPILSGRECLSVLGLGRDRPNQPYTEDQIQIGRLFAQIAALAIENATLQTTLTDLSIRDPLTGLFNRRYLFETLQREFARAVRDDYPISFVLLDIDQFKLINDRFGHGAGDAALRAMAASLQSVVRISDILCRYGGDEHMIAMPMANTQDALARAEDICRTIAQMEIPYQGDILRPTVSLGVATFPDHGSSIDEVIARADKALYHAKNTGRNQAVLYTPSITR